MFVYIATFTTTNNSDVDNRVFPPAPLRVLPAGIISTFTCHIFLYMRNVVKSRRRRISRSYECISIYGSKEGKKLLPYENIRLFRENFLQALKLKDFFHNNPLCCTAFVKRNGQVSILSWEKGFPCSLSKMLFCLTRNGREESLAKKADT